MLHAITESQQRALSELLGPGSPPLDLAQTAEGVLVATWEDSSSVLIDTDGAVAESVWVAL